MAFGSASTTVPSISITPSFLGMSSLLLVGQVVYRRPGNLPCRGGPLLAVPQASSQAHARHAQARRRCVRAAARHAKQTRVGPTRQFRPYPVTTPNPNGTARGALRTDSAPVIG